MILEVFSTLFYIFGVILCKICVIYSLKFILEFLVSPGKPKNLKDIINN